MTRGGKRDGAGRKSTGQPVKSIVRRLTIEDVDRLNNYDRLIAELAKLKEQTNNINTIADFKVYKLKGKDVIKVDDLVEAKLLKY
jgi:hypothetical protein